MRTMRDAVESLNLKATFDYAVPQQWWDDVYKKTGMGVSGVVWLYDDEAPIFGRPYSVTLYGWMVLRMYDIANSMRERW